VPRCPPVVIARSEATRQSIRRAGLLRRLGRFRMDCFVVSLLAMTIRGELAGFGGMVGLRIPLPWRGARRAGWLGSSLTRCSVSYFPPTTPSAYGVHPSRGGEFCTPMLPLSSLRGAKRRGNPYGGQPKRRRLTIPSRSSLRAKRSNPYGCLDCFVALLLARCVIARAEGPRQSIRRPTKAPAPDNPLEVVIASEAKQSIRMSGLRRVLGDLMSDEVLRPALFRHYVAITQQHDNALGGGTQ
jgi:hypothetical protein